METDRPTIRLVSYACARPNLSIAVQTTAINVYCTKNANMKIIARYEDLEVTRRTQLTTALGRLKQGDCEGLIVYGVPILTFNLSHRQCAEILANFLGPKASALYDVNGTVGNDTILAMRNSAIAQIHRDVD